MIADLILIAPRITFSTLRAEPPEANANANTNTNRIFLSTLYFLLEQTHLSELLSESVENILKQTQANIKFLPLTLMAPHYPADPPRPACPWDIDYAVLLIDHDWIAAQQNRHYQLL